MDKMQLEKLEQAGKIAHETLAFARSIAKKNMKLLDLAKQIDAKILQLGGKPAFPVNLSINEVAAHATPAYNDEELAHGLLKIDVGVHIEGYAADSAITVDLENSPVNKNLILAAETGLQKALEQFNKDEQFSAVGKLVEQTIASHKVQVIRNLTGHRIERFDLHAGESVPNHDDKTTTKIGEGVFAIEPFSTTGLGTVRDGRPSGIYQLMRSGSVRDNFAREVLAFIAEEYQTLPFCSRWIYEKFSSRGLVALRQIMQAGLLHEYAQLVEVSGAPVAQAEHTVIITAKEKIITTKKN